MTYSIEPLDDDVRMLYAEPRSTFLERRKELAGAARRDGDRERARLIAALRKPSVAAHALNLLAQTDDPALERLLELGAQVRQAFAAGEDGRMRELLQERNGAVADASKRAREVAKDDGESVSAAVNDQIVQTLRAAMAADDAADLVRSGTLTEALDEPGFAALGVGSGPVASQRSEPSTRTTAADPDRDAATAPRRTSKQRGATTTRGAPEKAAEDDLEEARRARAAREAEAAATAALDEAVSRLAISTDRRRELETQRDDAAAALSRIESELESARAAENDAEDEHRRAAEALDAARRAGPAGPTAKKAQRRR